MKGNIQIESFLDKPVWQMTGKEYIGLTQYALATVSGVGGNTMSERRGCQPLPVITLNQSQLLSGIDSNPSQPKSGNDTNKL